MRAGEILRRGMEGARNSAGAGGGADAYTGGRTPGWRFSTYF